MITKVLQALANNVRFGSKEPGMKKLNEFMDVQVVSLSLLIARRTQLTTFDSRSSS